MISAEYLPSIYMPIDRWDALAHARVLSERTVGTALFADISGFTPLTEALTNAFGARRGAEELTLHLNTVYTALIAEVHRYHGSVIGFSGDAITCWFDGLDVPAEHSALRAIACAQRMQQVMQTFDTVPLPNGGIVSLSVKTALATGPARRFQVGDPQAHLLDVLAGDTLQRMSHAEHVSSRGEIVIDEQTAHLLDDRAIVREWRTLGESGKRFAVLSGLAVSLTPDPWEILPPLPEPLIRPWLLPEVYDRLRSGLGDFLTELRPAVAIFLRFSGIDYDADENAGEKLNGFVCWVQSVLTKYGGILVDITIGDKGSYLYAAFGAPAAHEDDAHRAIYTVLELCALPADLAYIEPVQIGVSSGIMRAGACGGEMRRTYAVLGDEVNLAARLMQNAKPGTALVNRRVQVLTGNTFDWEGLPSIRVKGKSQPVSVACPLGELSVLSSFTQFHGALIGREQELTFLHTCIAPLFDGTFAGVLYIYGEPGVGKSRLIYEVRRQLESDQVQPCRWLTCPADPMLQRTLYPFKLMLRHFFGLETGDEHSDNEQKTQFDAQLDGLLDTLTGQPERLDLREELDKRRSFLGALLNLHWPGSRYELSEPKLRFENTLAALKLLILAESVRQPLVLQLEDAQLLDPDSLQLLEVLTQGASNYPFVIIAACRYRDDRSAMTINTAPGIPQHMLELSNLHREGVRSMAAQSLGLPPDETLLDFISQKTEGNPFFVEQLALELDERQLLAEVDGQLSLAQPELPEVPAGINAVLVSRLDRLSATVKVVVQVASVIGHEFELHVLASVLSDDNDLFRKIKQAEAEAIWGARTEAEYLFRHLLLRDAAYSMQPYEQLRQWHKRIAESIEIFYADNLPPHSAKLSYHFQRAEDWAREYTYQRMGGEFAISVYANAEAVQHLTRALELAENDREARFQLLQLRRKVFNLQGNRSEEAVDLEQMALLAEQADSYNWRTEAALAHAQYAELIGDYTGTASDAQRAITSAQREVNVRNEAFAHYYLALALWRQNMHDDARGECERAIVLSQQVEARDIEARTILILGNIAYSHSDYDVARAHYEQALTLRRALGDKQGESIVLGNLGGVAYAQDDLNGAIGYFEQNLQLSREIGDRRYEGIALSNLGVIYVLQGMFSRAERSYQQALTINRSTSDRRSETITLNNLTEIAVRLANYPVAKKHNESALALARAISERGSEITALAYHSMIAEHTGDSLSAFESAQQMLNAATTINKVNSQARALILLGHAAVGLDRLEEAADSYEQALLLRQTGDATARLEPATGLANVRRLQNRLTEAIAMLEPFIPDLLDGSLKK